MEGLTPYLEAPAIEEILAYVRTFAPGSLLASTWLNSEIADSTVQEVVDARNLIASMGEPFKFALPSERGKTEQWVQVRAQL